MSLPLMFYERDIITKKKPFVPPSVININKRILNEPAESTFHGRIVVNGENAVKLLEKKEAHTPPPPRSRIVVNGETVVEQNLSSEPLAEKPTPRRKVVN